MRSTLGDVDADATSDRGSHRQALEDRLRPHARRLGGTTLRQLCHGEGRRQRMSACAGELSFDYSHHLLDDAVVDELVAVASTAGLPAAIHAAFGPRTQDLAVQRRVRELADRVQGRRRGTTGVRIRHVVDVDLGGGHGRRMALQALSSPRDALDVRFVTEPDGTDLDRALRGLDPAATIVVVRSAASNALATRSAAASARAWLLDALHHEAAVRDHVVVVSDDDSALRWPGIEQRQQFDLHAGAGERSWLTTAAGLPLLLALGGECYDDLLAGLGDMDRHLRSTPWRDNLPVLMALVGLWNQHGLGLPPSAVLPCTEDLALLPAYVQQRAPEASDGTVTATVVPSDILAFTTPVGRSRAGHDQLLASSLPTSASDSAAERPSSTLLAPALTPRVLGQLLAAYEHKHFVHQMLLAPVGHDDERQDG